MDVQETGSGAAGTVEKGPSFVHDVEQLGERVVEGVKDDVEDVGRRLHEAFTGGGAAGVAEEAVAAIGAGATAAVAAIAALGSGHLSIGKLEVTAELAGAKTRIEEAIVTLARHIAGAASS